MTVESIVLKEGGPVLEESSLDYHNPEDMALVYLGKEIKERKVYHSREGVLGIEIARCSKFDEHYLELEVIPTGKKYQLGKATKDENKAKRDFVNYNEYLKKGASLTMSPDKKSVHISLRKKSE